jgi:hypothetical protein
MISVALSDVVYGAIESTLPKGAAWDHAVRSEANASSEVEADVVDCMRAMRRPKESYSQVILRLVERETSDPKKAVRLSGLRSVASHGKGRAFEGQSRDNKIDVALGLGTEPRP